MEDDRETFEQDYVLRDRELTEEQVQWMHEQNDKLNRSEVAAHEGRPMTAEEMEHETLEGSRDLDGNVTLPLPAPGGDSPPNTLEPGREWDYGAGLPPKTPDSHPDPGFSDGIMADGSRVGEHVSAATPAPNKEARSGDRLRAYADEDLDASGCTPRWHALYAIAAAIDRDRKIDMDALRHYLTSQVGEAVGPLRRDEPGERRFGDRLREYLLSTTAVRSGISPDVREDIAALARKIDEDAAVAFGELSEQWRALDWLTLRRGIEEAVERLGVAVAAAPPFAEPRVMIPEMELLDALGAIFEERPAEAPVNLRPAVRLWVGAYSRTESCSAGGKHKPSFSQSGGLIRCSQCGTPLEEQGEHEPAHDLSARAVAERSTAGALQDRHKPATGVVLEALRAADEAFSEEPESAHDRGRVEGVDR